MGRRINAHDSGYVVACLHLVVVVVSSDIDYPRNQTIKTTLLVEARINQITSHLLEQRTVSFLEILLDATVGFSYAPAWEDSAHSMQECK
ncbi:uncharacterized protein BDV14DRAFT_181151 [Aspergillus stella-maris]|uniref:uncharacterized protein n=1 Tax=Aspergillus stella-maris TaxID=1810926 RepID=UPI003CCDB6B3